MNWSGVLGKAQEQHGLISAAQAAELGVGLDALRWARRSHRLQRFLPHVYMLNGTPIDWNVRARGALLAAGPGAALSHSTAAALYGLPGIERNDEAPIHVLLKMGERVMLPDGYDLHRTTRDFKPYLLRNEFTVTRLARTLVDLAAIVDEETLEIALDGAHLRWRKLQTWLEEELGDRKTFDKDADQRTRLAALGWLSFEVTHTSVKEGDWPARLKKALQAREPQLKLFPGSATGK